MKLSKSFNNFFKSFIYVWGIPVVIGSTFWACGYKFWPVTVLSLGVELLALYLVIVIYRAQLVEKTKQAELEKIGNLSSVLNCAVCNQPNLITFIPDQQERVEFNCEKCHKQNVVTMQFTVALMTTPMDKLSHPIKDTVPNAFNE